MRQVTTRTSHTGVDVLVNGRLFATYRSHHQAREAANALRAGRTPARPVEPARAPADEPPRASHREVEPGVHAWTWVDEVPPSPDLSALALPINSLRLLLSGEPHDVPWLRAALEAERAGSNRKGAVALLEAALAAANGSAVG
jgi:hypothetical protein